MMTPYSSSARRLLGAAVVSLLSVTAAHAQQGGKLVATYGGWEVRSFPGYCIAVQGFDGDRSFRLASSSKGVFSFSFGADGAAAGPPGSKVKVTYWFGNDKKNRFTRLAERRKLSVAESGGIMVFSFVDPAGEPTHAANFSMDPSVTFSYTFEGEQIEASFPLKGLPKAYEKMWACSGG